MSKYSGKKVLIIGSSGFIGSKVLDLLRINFSAESIYLFHRHKNETENLNNITFDRLANYEFDIIVNCSGKYTNVEHEAMAANYLFLEKLLSQLKISTHTLFIHLSSYGVYNGNLDHLITKDTVPKALNPYEKSKVEADVLIRSLKCQRIIIMPSNVMDTSSKKIKYFKKSIFLKWIGTRIYYITPIELAKSVVDAIDFNLTSNQKIIFFTKVLSKKPNRFIKLKRLIHRLLAAYSSRLLPYYLFYFDTREFRIND